MAGAENSRGARLRPRPFCSRVPQRSEERGEPGRSSGKTHPPRTAAKRSGEPSPVSRRGGRSGGRAVSPKPPRRELGGGAMPAAGSGGGCSGRGGKVPQVAGRDACATAVAGRQSRSAAIPPSPVFGNDIDRGAPAPSRGAEGGNCFMGKALAAQPNQRGATGAMSRFPRYNAGRPRRNSAAGNWARGPTDSPATTCIRSGMPDRPRSRHEVRNFPAGFRGCQEQIPTRGALHTCRPTPTPPVSCHASHPALPHRNRPAPRADIRRKPRGIIHC